MTSKSETKNTKNVAAAVDQTEQDGSPVFLLEDLYPDASKLFAPAVVPSADNKDSLVAFDTNALLLPYNISSQDLSAFAKVLVELAKANRLFIPGRAAREFIKHRDRKLADMLQALRDKTSNVRLPEQKLSPLLDGVDGYADVTSAAQKLAATLKEYKKAQDNILDRMRDWRGNDPVSLVYNSVFVDGRVVELDEDREALIKEWDARRANNTPPGYKDSQKGDTGIGDFLIWKTLLKLGSTHKKDLIFITGDDKADWFVRSGGDRVYPRPELVDEFRRASGGRSLRLSTLGELLEEMNAPAEVVDEVKYLEQKHPEAMANPGYANTLRLLAHVKNLQKIEFDYSTNDGRMSVRQGNTSFEFGFSKASKDRIHVICGETGRIARVKGAEPGDVVNIDDYDSSSRSYAVAKGEVFAVENRQKDILLARIDDIFDDTRGDEIDEVHILCCVFERGIMAIAP